MRPDAVLEELACRQHGVLSRRQAVAAGVPGHVLDRRVAAGTLSVVHRGVYVLSAASDGFRQRAAAACLAAGDGAVASHRAAGTMWSLEAVPQAIDVIVVRPHNPRVHDVAVHRVTRLELGDITTIDSIPCTTPARTLIDLAGVVSDEMLEAAVDDAVNRGLVTPRYLRRRLDRLGRRGRKGAGTLEAVLAEGGDSNRRSHREFERRVRRLLRAHGFPSPVAQHPVRLGDGSIRYLDFAYPELLIAIEVDSWRHHGGNRRAWARDHVRNRDITALGWRIIPVTWEDLAQPDGFLAALAMALDVGAVLRSESGQVRQRRAATCRAGVRRG